MPHTSFEVKLTPNKMNKVNNWFKPWVSKSAFYSIQKERCYKRGRVFFSATQAVDTLFLIFQFIIEITNYFYIAWFILIGAILTWAPKVGVHFGLLLLII